MTQTESATLLAEPPETLAGGRRPKPITDGQKAGWEQGALYFFVIVPFLAVAAAVPVAWGWGLGWHDVVLAVFFYLVSGLGVTVGFHRHFTHGSFKAKRALRIAMAIAGTMAIEGPVIGWLFDVEHTNQERFAPDLLADKDMVRVERQFPLWVAVTMLGPALLGGLWSLSFAGALSAFFWATLVRLSVLHHVTWSINSVCHTIGERPFVARDKSANFWPLAILSFGESWHNSHHADPSAARHGVLRGQLDISARVIELFERLGWAYDVRWPSPERIASKLATERRLAR